MFTTGFTDPQGTTFEAAVFQVLRSDFTINTSETYSFDIREQVGSAANETSNFSLNYRMGYWASQDAKESGAPPYTLIDPNTYSSDFASYTLDGALYSELEAEAAAELHCKTEVIGA